MPSLSRPIRRVITLVLGLALLGALWTTALGSLSSEGSAVPMLTSAGTELLNPLLTANGNGVASGAWNAIQQQAKAHPDQSVSLPGIKVPVKGQDIAGMSFAQGTQVIYRQVAEAWYAHGITFAFNLPAPLQHAVSTYDPFVSKSLNVPGLPKVSLPQIPSFLAPVLTHLGLSPTTLTASGHRSMLNLSRWFWIFSAALALALAVFSSGWHRLSNPAWSLFHASWHIALIGVAAWFLINHNKTAVAPYMGVVGPIGGAFFPIYGTAALVGLAGIIGSGVAKRGMRLGAGIGRMASRREEAVPVAAPRRPISQPPFQPDVASRAPFGRSSFDQQPAPRDFGSYGDSPAQGPSYAGQNAGQGWPQPQPQQQPQRSAFDESPYGSQGYGQAPQSPQRASFGDQAGYQPTRPMWDLPDMPPSNTPQPPQPPSAFPGSPDYAPRPRGSSGGPAYPSAPQRDGGGQDYGQRQPGRDQQPAWPPNPDRDSGGW